MDPRIERLQNVTRRQFLQHCQVGVGTAALASLLGRDLSAAESQSGGAPRHRRRLSIRWLLKSHRFPPRRSG